MRLHLFLADGGDSRSRALATQTLRLRPWSCLLCLLFIASSFLLPPCLSAADAPEAVSRIQALCAAAVAEASEDRRAKLLEAVIGIANTDRISPVESTQALHVCGNRHEKGPDKLRLWTAASRRWPDVAPDSRQHSNTLLNLGGAYAALGDSDKEIAFYREALRIRAALDSKSNHTGRAHYHLGSALLESDKSQARVHLRAAVELLRGSPNVSQFLWSLTALAGIHFRSGELEQADELLSEVLAVQKNSQHPPYPAAYDLLADVARKRGDLNLARTYLDVAINAASPNSREEAHTSLVLSAIEIEQRDYAAAEKALERSGQYFCKTARRHPGCLNVLNNRGLVALRLGDLATAESVFRSGIERSTGLFDRTGFTRNLALVLLQRSSKEDGEVARKTLLEAEQLLRSVLKSRRGELFYQAEVKLDLARVLGWAKKFDECATLTDDALRVFEAYDPFHRKIAFGLDILARLAQVRGDSRADVEHLKRAWEIVRRQDLDLNYDSAINQAGSIIPWAENLIEAQIRVGDVKGALKTFEQSRARSLLRLQHDLVRDSEPGEKELLQAYRAANRALGKIQTHLDEFAVQRFKLEQQRKSSSGEMSPALLNQQFDELLEQEEAWLLRRNAAQAATNISLAELRAAYPTQYEPSLNFEAVHRALGEKSDYVGFSVSDNATHVFLVGGNPEQILNAARIDLGEIQIRELVQKFRATLLSRTGGASSRRNRELLLATLGKELYETLFPGKIGARIAATYSLVISPDGPLWSLPFAALPIPGDKARERLLGTRVPIRYVNSPGELNRENVPSAVQRSSTEALVVGGIQGSFSASRRDVVDLTSPPELLYSERESVQIAKLYGVQPTLGSEASEANFRDRAPKSSVVHISGHGFLHDQVAMASGLLLTPRTEESEDDGVLLARDFWSDIRLDADLVVLSACDTGRGDELRGEGVNGLTRAVQFSGARSVVSTIWKVNDRASAKFSVMFHEEVRSGSPLDLALHSVMKEMASRRASRDPYFWAGFSLYGSNLPISAFDD